MTLKVLKVATNGDPVATQEPKGPRRLRGGGVNLKEKRMPRNNPGDVENRGRNCAACGRKCASSAGFAAHHRCSHPQ